MSPPTTVLAEPVAEAAPASGMRPGLSLVNSLVPLRSAAIQAVVLWVSADAAYVFLPPPSKKAAQTVALMPAGNAASIMKLGDPTGLISVSNFTSPTAVRLAAL